jgi:hypothetical protein
MIFDDIANCVDQRIIGLAERINLHPTVSPQLNSGSLRQLGSWTHANADDDQIGVYRLAPCQFKRRDSFVACDEVLHRYSQSHFHAGLVAFPARSAWPSQHPAELILAEVVPVGSRPNCAA